MRNPEIKEYGKKGERFCKLRWVRQRQGFTMQRLSETSGVNLRLLKAYEYGERDFNRARVDIVYRIATALGVSVEEIIDVKMDME